MPMEDEELLLKQLPHSVEAEQAVLGSMLIDARCVPEVIDQLRPDDFYVKQNREIYETIYSMFNYSLTIDPVTVLENMKQNGVYDENTSRGYLLQLMDTTPTAANVKEYIGILKDKTLLRRVAETAGELTVLIQQGTETGQDVLEAAEQRIYAIRQGRAAQGLTPISQVLLDVYARLEELAASDSAIPGLSTGLTDLDRAISGLNKSDLILLAARPGMGKTSMALNILLEAGKKSGKMSSSSRWNEPGAAGPPSHLQRVLCGQQEAGHRQPGPGGLGEDHGGHRVPEPLPHPHRRRLHRVGGRHPGQVPPGGQPGAGHHRLPSADAVPPAGGSTPAKTASRWCPTSPGP